VSEYGAIPNLQPFAIRAPSSQIAQHLANTPFSGVAIAKSC
jgi:hypothetical protein